MNTKPLYDLLKKVKANKKDIFTDDLKDDTIIEEELNDLYNSAEQCITDVYIEDKEKALECIDLFYLKFKFAQRTLATHEAHLRNEKTGRRIFSPVYASKARYIQEMLICFDRLSGKEEQNSAHKEIDKGNEIETKKIEIKKDENAPKIIHGVREFAKYLGIGTTKASSLIKQEILPKDIQYKVGDRWYFNREKLDKYMVQNPDVFTKKAKK